MGQSANRFPPIVSFDVFDTLLTRAIGEPIDLFLLLGRKLLLAGEITCSAEIFARDRVHAEERANSLRHPATLEVIYRELVRSRGLLASRAESLAEAERQLERTLSRKVPGADQLVNQPREAGSAVIFVTDTYFSSAFIEKLLRAQGLYRPEDRIFASCECHADKSLGLLFPYVSRSLGTKPSQLLHHGNHAIADCRNGRLSGWKVRFLPQANLNRYERALTAQAFATGGMSSLLAGSARSARLSSSSADTPSAITTVAAGVMAPTLVAWMMWTLRQAKRDGLERLYFVSRDGQVLLDIAQRLQPALGTTLDLRYLYSSRQATQLAGSPEASFRDMLRLQSCRMVDVIEFLNLDPATFATLLPADLQDRTQWSANLSPASRDRLLALVASEPFQELFRRQSTAARDMLLSYLAQEGWAEDIAFGVVDVGWRASLAGILPIILAGSALQSPERFYFFGLGNDAQRNAGPVNADRLEAWFYDDSSRHGYLPYMANISSLLEMFCAGDHGAVTGFHHTDAGIVPVLRSPTSPMQDWGLAAMRHTTSVFTKHLVTTLQSDLGAMDLDVDLRRAIAKVLKLFWQDPSEKEVRAWGSFPVEVTFNNTIIKPIAEKVGVGQLWHAVRTRRLSFRSSHSWPHGTAQTSSWPVRLLLTTLWRLRQNTGRWRHRLRWLKTRLRD